MTVDYPDYASPQAHADRIFATGVPLYSKSSAATGSPFTGTLTGGAQTTLANIAVAQIGYEVGLSVQCNAGSTSPFLTVLFQWTDSVSGFLVDQQRWSVPGGSGAYQVYYGTGPTAGDTLTVTLINQDLVNSTLYKLSVTQNSRVYTRHDWRQQTTVVVPTFVNGNYDVPGGFVLEAAPSVGAGATANRIGSLYCGRARLQIFAANAFTVSVFALDPVLPSVATGQLIYTNKIAAAGGGQVNDDINLPRAVVFVQVINNGAGTITMDIALVVEEVLP